MNGAPSLLVNQIRSPKHWVAFHLIGTGSNRDAIGARLSLRAGGRLRVDEVRSGSSYSSNSDMRVHFGLGQATKIDFVEVRWPSGLRERFDNLSINAIQELKEGSGAAMEKPAELTKRR
jgi:hypothetical protein